MEPRPFSYELHSDPIAHTEATVTGKTFRITLLTSRFIRLEYSASGQFEDRASQRIWFRNQPVPIFSFNEQNHVQHIETDHLVITYHSDKPYNSETLEIQLKQNGQKWRFGDKGRSKNLKGTYRTLDEVDGSIPLDTGLISRQGWSIIDDSKTLVFDEKNWLVSREKDHKDYYFLGYGHEYLAAIQDYYKISGPTPLIPRYVLGNWWSRYHKYDEQEFKDLVDDFETFEIPLAVVILDMDWHLVDIPERFGSGWTGFTWNRELFPQPADMLSWLKDKNLKVALNLHPALGIRAHEEMYPQVAQYMDIDPGTEQTVEFDVTDPVFMEAYFELVLRPYEQMGVDFWWMDWQQGTYSKIGLDPLWMVNHLHFYDMVRRGLRPVIFSRWADNGNQRYPIGFSGDTYVSWASLQFQPYFTATASNVGYGWWSHDIGGHMYGKEESELYVRWVQFGAFSPILRLHSTKGEFYRREPWKHVEPYFEHAMDVLGLRHRMIPYIYSMAKINTEAGIPLIRPMYYFAPQDKRAYEYDNQYWFGSELIVHPITQPLNPITKRVYHTSYLPDGIYFDYFSGEYLEGDRVYANLYDLSDIPVFVKAGGIVIEDREPRLTGVSLPKKLVCNIFPGASNKYVLYEDDGETMSYVNGDFQELVFTLEWSESPLFTITYQGKDLGTGSRHIDLVFHNLSNTEDPIIESSGNDHPTVEQFVQDIVVSVDLEFGETLSVQFGKVELMKPNYFRQDAYQMLMESAIKTTHKEYLDEKYFADGEFTNKQLSSLVQDILVIDTDPDLVNE